MSTNLGLVKAIFRQVTSPVPIDVLWYDTVNKVLKYFHITTLTWLPLMRSQLTGLLTNTTPTSVEITTIIGLTAVQAGVGFQVTIFNTNDNKLYRVESNGVNWFYRMFGSITLNDWFLPSKDELFAMYTEIKVHGVLGVGAFIDDYRVYWSSTETSAVKAAARFFLNGTESDIYYKADQYWIRACRAFISSIVYALRDVGPAGGLIFNIINLGGGSYSYLEAAPFDIVGDTYPWSNIINVSIGTTSTAIGTGQSNTIAIINQAGHTDSAAKLCNDLIV